MMILECFLGSFIVLNFVVIIHNGHITDSGPQDNTGYDTSTYLNDYGTHIVEGLNVCKSDRDETERTDMVVLSTVPLSLNNEISTLKDVQKHGARVDGLDRNISSEQSVMEGDSNTPMTFAILQSQISSVKTEDDQDRTSLNSLIFQDPCAQLGTCATSSTIQFKYCYCDEKCFIYNDCCIDTALFNFSNTSNFKCRHFSNLSKYMYTGAFMISTCPFTFMDKEINDLCLNDDFMEVGPPVFGTDSLLYKNKFCAICHGVISNQFFQLQIFILDNPDMNSLLNKTQKEKMSVLLRNNVARYKFVATPRNMHFRQCLITRSPENETSTCQQYSLNPVVAIDDTSGDAVFYRNMYCVPADLTLKLCIGPDIDQFSEDKIRDHLYDVHPLSVIFGFDVDDACMQKTGGVCDSAELYYNYTHTLGLDMKYNNSIAVQFIKQIWLSIAWSLSLQKVTKLTFFKAFSCNTSCHIEVGFMALTEQNLQELLIFKSNLNSLKWNAEYLDILTGETINVHAYASQQTVSNRNPMLSLEENNLNTKNIENLLRKENTSISTYVVPKLCNDFFLFTNVRKNESVKFIIQNVQCVVSILLPQTIVSMRTIATYICISISVISQFVSIVICRIIGITKSVAGSNTENLSVSLALANILFLLGVGANDDHVVCFVIGIILHYLWLTVFVFMSVAVLYIGYHLRKITLTQNSTHGAKKQKIYLTIVGLVVPIFIVAPSVVLDHFNVRNFKAYYGGVICFPTTFPSNLVFFSGPILLCIAINLVQLIMLIVYIATTKKEVITFQRSQSFQQVHVYVRVTIITGALWVIGIIGGLLQSEILNDIFIFLCCLQGFFIAISCLSTRSARSFIRRSVRAQTSKMLETEVPKHSFRE